MNNGVSWEPVPPAHRDWIGILSVLSTTILAVALFICVALLSHAQTEAANLRQQLGATTNEATCRARFQNEDDRLDRLGNIAFRSALIATGKGDQTLLDRIATYNAILAPAAIRASMARTASPDTCQADPTSFPIPANIPPFPTN